MVENLGRKLTTIFVLLATSIALLTLKDVPLNLGLDLQGGTRINLSVDFDEAFEAGLITPRENADRQTLLIQMISIFRERIDPYGTLEPVIRTEGSNSIIIEMPGNAGMADRKASAPIIGELAVGGDSVVLGAGSEGFPAGGGEVKIGREEMRYTRVQEIKEAGVVVGKRLVGLSRGLHQTVALLHATGEVVDLTSTNEIRNAIENLGKLAFQITATATDYTVKGTYEVVEREKLATWLEANPNSTVESFNAVTTENGGPNELISWFTNKDNPDAPTPQISRAVALLNMPALAHDDWVFSGEALEQAYASQDTLGLPAVGFQMTPDRVGDFTDFTEKHIGRGMAIVLNGEIESTAYIKGVLPGSGQIYGKFTSEYVDTLVTVLRTGSLRIKPTIQSEERVSATLGDAYVRRGFISSAVALLAVMIFMIGYYRRFGVYAAVALLSTLLMLLGSLSFLNATLTLPGVAGIILTVGMAVDANILIFDRVREEMDKGRNIKQAAKNGFSRAAVTIFDANLTTLLTAIVLYNVGTGPVKGFAVTLMVGVLTSMFSALTITKVMVHKALESGVKELHFGTWLVTANYGFMAKAKTAIAGSLVAIVAGLALFISLDDQTKLGIDFLGGATMQVRTAEPVEIDKVRELVATIEGDIGKHSEIVGVRSEAGEGSTYSMFRITFKTVADGQDSGDTFKNQINTTLGDILLTEPILANVTEGTENASMQLHFAAAHETETIQAVLAGVGIRDVAVTRSAGEGSYSATGRVNVGTTGAALAVDLRKAFDASTGETFKVIEPGADFSQVGTQVVGELRDKAILAILISLFSTVMYIRVRFAEYSYGIAAVVAVIHDVLITLGVLSIFMYTGIVQVEITVAMIAAFLTIIGYSLNDTIVLFDRVRENLPRMETGLSDILNTSVNQTLSRTILTSLTTLLAVTVLFVANFGTGNVLESFAVTMMIGVFVGTYSSVFIANPVLLFLENRSAARRKAVKDGVFTTETASAK